MAVLEGADVAAEFGSGGFECPAEHVAVELLGALDIRGCEVNPGRGTYGCALTDRHDGLSLRWWGRSVVSTGARRKTHRGRSMPSTRSALSLKINGSTSGFMSSVSKSRRHRSSSMYG